jgi:hypothetical protein
MPDHRKQAISIRLGESDLRNIKRLAQRLGVRDSEIIRFAIKSMLNRSAPLCDDSIRGRNLVPVLIESGDELIRHFELDAYRLDTIINERVEEAARVHRDDLALLAMSGLRDQYLMMRLKETNGCIEPAGHGHTLRAYLYDKYVYGHDEPKPGEAETAQDGDVRAGQRRPAA